MFVPVNKPLIKVNGVTVDNVSPDGKVFFMEEGHKYYHVDDVVEGNIVDFFNSKYEFRSPTGILAQFKEHFDAERISERYVEEHGLEISAEELRNQWTEKAKVASDRGSKLHAYCESIYDGWDFGEIPQEPQARQAEKALKLLDKAKWRLSKTELLVYNTKLKLAGQVDLLMKKAVKIKGKPTYIFGIFDYKFLKEPIKKKSYFNPYTRQFKMMSGPFKYLMDCNYYHYSIQMELYRMLMGDLGKRVYKKTLIVMVEDDYDFVDGYDIKIWVDKYGTLQAKYKKYNGDIYDSSKDVEYDRDEPYQIINK